MSAPTSLSLSSVSAGRKQDDFTQYSNRARKIPEVSWVREQVNPPWYRDLFNHRSRGRQGRAGYRRWANPSAEGHVSLNRLFAARNAPFRRTGARAQFRGANLPTSSRPRYKGRLVYQPIPMTLKWNAHNRHFTYQPPPA